MHFDLANVEFEILMSAWPPPNQRIGCKFLKPGEVECNKELDVKIALQINWGLAPYNCSITR